MRHYFPVNYIVSLLESNCFFRPLSQTVMLNLEVLQSIPVVRNSTFLIAEKSRSRTTFRDNVFQGAHIMDTMFFLAMPLFIMGHTDVGNDSAPFEEISFSTDDGGTIFANVKAGHGYAHLPCDLCRTAPLKR